MNTQPGNLPLDAFAFGTKAQTLERLRARLNRDLFCEQFAFYISQWRRDPEAVIDRCLGSLPKTELAVRSSAANEDTSLSSMAGTYHSVLGVSPEPKSLFDSVEAVIDSYGDRANGIDQVLVQPLVRNTVISGVIVTRDIDSGAPYYVINYDDTSGRTDSVTSGSVSKTILVHRDRYDRLKSPRIQNLIHEVRNIENVTGDDRLDIEFCITDQGDLFILQVRPLATQNNWTSVADDKVQDLIDVARTDLEGLMRPENGVLGNTTIFGQMPDWNPAEMIGSRPKPLAYSLYENQITNGAWAVSRYKMGYRDLRGRSLMTSFARQPYIDVRLSFNSLLPAKLEPSVGEKLVNHQLTRLAANQDLHDKIEFEIAFPNFDFRFDKRVGELTDAGLDDADIDRFRQLLLDLTWGHIRKWPVSVKSFDERLARLNVTITQAETMPPIDAVRSLLGACVPFGTVPFAESARHGFIGVSLLKSLVSEHIFSKQEGDLFLASVNTVAHDMIRDLVSMQSGDLERDRFLEHYGHLRPGTYDISTFSYRERPELYLGGSAQANHQPEFVLSDASRQKAIRILSALDGPDLETMLEYISGAVKARESTKFKFTRAISRILENIVKFGEDAGLDREALAWLTISEILDGSDDPKWLEERIAVAMEAGKADRLVRMPHILTSPVDVDIVRVPLGEPTFITQQIVVAPLALLGAGEVTNIDGRIVLIESADPGFDWILSHDIAGLVTKFGGANSHMAIRCAEFRLPAAIGCGERLFSELADADIVHLNCAAHAVSRS